MKVIFGALVIAILFCAIYTIMMQLAGFPLPPLAETFVTLVRGG